MQLKKLAGALSFAHLLGLPTSAAAAEEDDKEKKDAAARAEDDDKKQRPDESDEDYAKRMEEEDEKKKDDTDSKKGKAAEDDDEKKDDAKGKRADDDGDDDSMRRAERSRCAAIVAFGIQNGCVRQAGVFAFDTDMTTKQAIAALEAGAADGPRRGSLASRMAGTHIPNVGTGDDAQGADASTPAGKAKAMADQIIRAGMKRRNEKA